MNWPSMSDYQDAIQSPRTCFTDGPLKSGTPALNPLGLPQPITGGFASVYQVRSGRSRWAVRCFLHRIPDLRERYALISRYLKKKTLRCMVAFDYLPEGIRVKGDWYPALKMEWVDGDTLNVHVKKNLGNSKGLLKMADRWNGLVENLERSGIGHCDLQHGNVLVKSGEFRLIDYDGMFVPALQGRGSHEKGHPAYQHPRRSGRDFGGEVDRFPALVIYVSLLALAREPKLWDRFYDDDNLLFRRSDFLDSAASPVFEAMNEVGDTEVKRLAEILQRACEGSLRDIPRLSEARAGLRPVKAAVPAAPRVNPPPRTEKSPAAVDPVRVSVLTSAAAPARAHAAPPPPRSPIQLPAWLTEHPTPASPSPGWQVEWMRPGPLQERHVHKEPVYGTHEVERRFLFLPLGKRRVRFVERYEDRVEDRTSRIEGHRSTIRTLAFSQDGAVLASGSLDRTVRIWNVGTGRELSLCLDARAEVLALSLIPGRAAVVAALSDGRLVIWDYGLHRQIIHLRPPDHSGLEAVAVSRDGRWVAAGGKGRSAFVWQADRGIPAGGFESLGGKVGSLAFTNDASGLICATRNGQLELLDRGTRNPRWSARTQGRPVVDVAVPPRASHVVAVTEEGRIGAWDLRNGLELSIADPGVRPVRSAGLSPDATHAMLGMDDRTARITRTAGGAETARLEGHRGRVTAVALSPTGKAVATGCKDGTVRLWVAR